MATGRQLTLAHLAELTLGISMDKDPTVRMSKWSAQTLLDRQQEYAALDVIVPLRIYKHLDELPDLTVRPTSGEAATGLVVDVVLSHGSLVILTSAGVWTTPLAGTS